MSSRTIKQILVDLKAQGYNILPGFKGKQLKFEYATKEQVEQNKVDDLYQRMISVAKINSYGECDLSLLIAALISRRPVEFGDYAGKPKWERALQVPHQNIRDALITLITVQGDTEFASVEQQRHLLDSAPTDYDRYSAARIMVEEQRHGWQMCYLLMTYFGKQGAREAQKLLERNAQEGSRLLGAFNRPMPHWLDFCCYTMFVDRDGKFQLGMLHGNPLLV